MTYQKLLFSNRSTNKPVSVIKSNFLDQREDKYLKHHPWKRWQFTPNRTTALYKHVTGKCTKRNPYHKMVECHHLYSLQKLGHLQLQGKIQNTYFMQPLYGHESFKFRQFHGHCSSLLIVFAS